MSKLMKLLRKVSPKRVKRLAKVLIDIFYKQTVREYRKNPAFRRRTQYARYYKRCRIDEDTILYESFHGRGMVCNPYAIFKEILTRPECANLKHVWALDDFEANAAVIDEYKDSRNVSFVKCNSKQYLKALCTAKYLVNNMTWQSYFTKKEDQVYLNTWHGIALKYLGFDIPDLDGYSKQSNVVRNFLLADYIVSGNVHMTERFRDSYKLDGLYSGRLIEDGFPRNDTILKTDRNRVIGKLRRHGIEIDENKKVILYAPTWRGFWTNPNISTTLYSDFLETLGERIDTDEYQILLRPHYVVYKHLKDNNKRVDSFVSAALDANEVLSITDILVSDYSSIFFDYMLTDRPILFHIPDLEDYTADRGLYFSAEELPGPHTDSLNDIAAWINNIGSVGVEYEKKYAAFKQRAVGNDDSNASGRVVDALLYGKTEELKIVDGFDKVKKKLLFYGSGMPVNGITASLLNLLDNVDYNEFDVSVYIQSAATDKEKRANILRINENARILCRNSTYNATFAEIISHKLFMKRGYKNKFWKSMAPKAYFKKEVKRSFGDSEFDYVIDYTGYNAFFSVLLQHFATGYKIIWQHNDMLAEKTKRFPSLAVTFSTHPHYDRLVSCTKAIMDVNRSNLATESTRDKHTYCRNMVDYKRVISAIDSTYTIELDGIKYCACTIESNENGPEKLKLFPFETRNTVTLHKGKNYLISSRLDNQNGTIDLSLLSEAHKSSGYSFVTIGRLSPEKNHHNLIQAFVKLLSVSPKSMLYIVGNGPLYKKLQALIDEHGVNGSVILTGNLENPFGLVNACDCFILPSLYEGQGIVLLEARVLKKPIVVSGFDALPDTLIDNGQYVIGSSVEDIYSGMIAFAEGKVPADYDFDPEQYNKEVYQEFLNVLSMGNVEV
jgi:CDP-glycerol glycerophosphotransferase (TagB/SpsB family)